MTTKPKKAQVDIKLILRHPFLQMRAKGTEEGHARDLTDAIKRKEKVPPIEVVKCVNPETPDLEGIYVVNGWHTLAGYEANKAKTVPVLMTSGLWEDAVLAAGAANADQNALKRTRADKRLAVERLIATFPKWSASRIAEAAKVSKDLAAEVKGEKRAVDATEEEVVDSIGRTHKARVKPKAEKKKAKQQAAKEKAKQAAPGDWRYVELTKILHPGSEKYVFDALASAGIYQAHQFMRAMADGTPIGLEKGIIDQIKKEVEATIPGGEAELLDAEGGKTGKPGQGSLVFDWPRWNAAAGVVVRGVDAFFKTQAKTNSAEHKKLLEDFGRFVASFKKEYQRLTGEPAPA